MSSDLIVKPDTLEYGRLNAFAMGSTDVGVLGTAIGVTGKVASIFCKNNSMPQKILKSVSRYGIFAGALGFAALGGTYFLLKSVSDDDIKKQEQIVENNNNKNNYETPLLNFVQGQKLTWLRIKKDIQQSIYSLLGWRE